MKLEISMQISAMAVAVVKMFICSRIVARPFGNGLQDIGKDKEGNLGAVAGFEG